MNKRGVKMLEDIYGVPHSKIKLIPHGIPDLPFADSTYYKRKLSIERQRTILTFGLLSKNKGIEVMLKALPTIVKADPSVLYIVLGATHPEVLRHEGQSYKLKLQRMVMELGLQRNVVFHNRFVDGEELLEFLGAADIYVTPYLNREQLTSGTLSFAVGAGKAVFSSPYWAAQELLAKGRGKLVRFADSEHLAHSIVEILSNNALFHSMRKRAYEYGRSMTWSKVGQAYWSLFESKAPSLTIPLTPRLDSSNWEMPAYNQHGAHFAIPPKVGGQQVYQSA
jgi:glycosyltransferase involved in cell wall biosynthesis